MRRPRCGAPRLPCHRRVRTALNLHCSACRPAALPPTLAIALPLGRSHVLTGFLCELREDRDKLAKHVQDQRIHLNIYHCDQSRVKDRPP